MSTLPAGVDYQFMGFKLVRQTSVLSEKGEFCVDALRVKFEPTVNASVEQIEGQTNTNGKTIENGNLYILSDGVKYNAEGKLVK
jgi:hypothetical protein